MQFLPLLLNWRLWVALALAGASAYLHHMGYESGKEEVQSVFDAHKVKDLEQAMAAQVLRQEQEAAMTAANLKVTQDYESLKVATASAVLALDRDRVRLQAALAAYRGATGSDSGAGLPIDDSALVGSFSECIDRYSALASELDQEGDTLRSLQGYVRDVVKP